MTLPASGQITFNDINVEHGRSGTTANTTLDYLNGLIKASQRPANPNMDAFHNKAYYQRNADGNCNNGNAGACNCNCGGGGGTPINCNNCVNCNAINCVNCDTQSWFQTNCNCACTYNCNVNSVSYDCDCACSS